MEARAMEYKIIELAIWLIFIWGIIRLFGRRRRK